MSTKPGAGHYIARHHIFCEYKMNPKIRLIIVLSIFFFIQSTNADYVMMCIYFSNPVAKIYRVQDDGEITFDYNVELDGNPWKIDFVINDLKTLRVDGNTSFTLISTDNPILCGSEGDFHFYVTRVNDDGTLTYLPERDFTDTGHVSAMAFVPETKSHGFMLY